MEIDLRNVPFSRNGAYLAFSILPGVDGRPEGLYLRSVHGGAQSFQPGGRVALVEVLVDGRPVPYEVRASPSGMDLNTIRGTLSICISDPWVIRLRGEGVTARLTFHAASGDYAIPASEGRCRVNCPSQQINFMFTPLDGRWQVFAPWTGTGAREMMIELIAGEDGGVCEGAIEEYASVWRPRAYEMSFDECRVEVQAEFVQWLEQMPKVPPEYAQARRLAAYVNWSSVVEPVGHFLRPAMYMSKNWMTNVWSWDHCFNAMALTYHKQMMAWDQLMLMFDMQDEHGALPDSYNDRHVSWNFCKPPIHGWVLQWMMDRTSFVRSDQVRQIYGPMCRWTEWWFRYRDDDHDGIPEYHHGNDSGWDNATPFEVGVPLESPDLCAYLVLQMETLAKLAASLNDTEEAESWQRRSEELLQKMLEHFWQGDHFVAMRAGDHLLADTESLILYLPLLLGRRLPVGVRRELVNGLSRADRFLTPYGLATESPQSKRYDPDGYWRGPIWAPSTMILCEGLAAAGEMDLVKTIARRFCDMAAQSGFAENYNALTGEGLRDRAYTWTSSVFLVLAHEYLMENNTQND